MSESAVAAINDNIFKILEEVGFNQATPHCIETCTAFGAVMGNDGRMRMPREVVEKAMQLAERNLILCGQDPKHDLTLTGSRVHFSTAGAAVMIAWMYGLGAVFQRRATQCLARLSPSRSSSH